MYCTGVVPGVHCTSGTTPVDYIIIPFHQHSASLHPFRPYTYQVTLNLYRKRSIGHKFDKLRGLVTCMTCAMHGIYRYGTRGYIFDKSNMEFILLLLRGQSFSAMLLEYE